MLKYQVKVEGIRILRICSMSGIMAWLLIFFRFNLVNFILELRSKIYAVRVGYAVVCDRHIPVAIRTKVPSSGV